MTMSDIIANIESGKYKTSLPYPQRRHYHAGHVFDETQSVRWNLEKDISEIISENERLDAARKAYSDDKNAKQQLFRGDLTAALQDDYGLSLACAAVVFRKAEDDGHWAGFHEIVSQAQILADFAIDILKAKESEK